MQWDGSANLGFSTGSAGDLYLPVDPSEDAPTVAAQETDPSSLLNTVRAILALRHQEVDLQADAPFQVVCSEPGRPFVYRRGKLLCAVNPTGRELEVSLPKDVTGAADRASDTDHNADRAHGADRAANKALSSETLFVIGNARVENGILKVGAQSFAVFR